MRRQVFLRVGGAPCKNQLSLASWAMLNARIQVQYVRHPSYGQWTLTVSRRGIWASSLKSHMYVSQLCTWVCVLIKFVHLFHHPNWEKTRFSLATPSSCLQLCNCWTSSNFVGMIILFSNAYIIKLASTCKWPFKMIIVSSNALDIKGRMKLSSSLECTLGNKGLN